MCIVNYKDPDIRATSTGSRLASFSIATSTKYRNKDTQQLEDKTEWHRIVVFNDKLADICEKYLRKGSKIYIEGQLQTRKWTDNNGVDKYTTEVVIPNYSGVLTMLDSRAQSSVSEENTSQLDSAADEALGGSDNSTAEQLDDDIPF